MHGGATFDASGAYRYHLWREWDQSRPPVTFVMLNPSSADADRDDPTILRCIGFARGWGYGRLEVVNLFAWRAASPRDLFSAIAPEGPANREYLARVAGATRVLAWGNHGRRAPAGALQLAVGGDTRCLGLTAIGQPRHPLYVRAGCELIAFEPSCAASEGMSRTPHSGLGRLLTGAPPT